MQLVKSVLNGSLGWFGLEIRRVRRGRDAIRDARELLGGRMEPVIFDVGANVGQSIEKFRRQFKRPIIHAFEPSCHTFQDLKSRTKDFPLLTLNRFALGSEPGTVDFFENSQSDMSSLLPPGERHWGRIDNVTHVPVDTLDRYCQHNEIDRIDLLKIDTQGYDLEVLRGGNRMLSENRINGILIEITFIRIYEGAPRFDDVFRFLLDRGFNLVSFYDTIYRNDAVAWTDALFARS